MGQIDWLRFRSGSQHLLNRGQTATVKSQLTQILAANFGGVNTGSLLLANTCNSEAGNRL